MGLSYVDAISIVLISLTANFLMEGLSWYFVYRKDTYKTSRARIEDLNRRLEKERSIVVALDKRKAQEKKTEKINEDIKAATAQINSQKFKINIAVSLFLMLVYRLTSRLFYGKSVATLPFDPITFIRGMTHRGIEGEDFYECSFAFIYALCTMSFKGSIQKALGHSMPRSSSNMTSAAAEAEKMFNK